MLALKKALVKVDPIPVLIFDESMLRFGGRLGTVTGIKLRELSRGRQVILITHLPQIASFADFHFKVRKIVQNNHTTTSVELLDPEARVKRTSQNDERGERNQGCPGSCRRTLTQATKIS